jgi:hypothetical protein
VVRKPLFLAIMTLSVAATVLVGCGTESTNSIRGEEVKKQSISNNAVQNSVVPTSTVYNEHAPTQAEVPPVTHTKYPQHATEHLVPEIWSVPKGDVAPSIQSKLSRS